MNDNNTKQQTYTLLSPEGISELENIEAQALNEMAQVRHPIWRRHLEDLAAACSAVISATMRSQDHD